MSTAVIAFVEHTAGEPRLLSRESLVFAHDLATRLGAALDAILLGSEAEVPARRLGSYGIGLAHVATDVRFDDYAPAAWAAAIREVVRVRAPVAVVAPGSERGNEVLAHVAARLGLPMSANTVDVSPDTSWHVVRQRWGGALLEDASLDAPIRLLSVAPHAVALPLLNASAPAPTITRFEPDLDPWELVVRVVSREHRT